MLASPPPRETNAQLNSPNTTHSHHPTHPASLAKAHILPTPYLRDSVPQDSPEFKFVCDKLLTPVLDKFQFFTIDRITNPSLISQFESRRNLLIRLKSRDPEQLRECGLSDCELELRMQSLEAFDKLHGRSEKDVAGLPAYNDNCVLLFHGSRGDSDKLLTQGLDNRIANPNGLFGPGIYFADDPRKSIAYIKEKATLYVFQVLLGDCVFQHPNMGGTVRHLQREPEKSHVSQKRTRDDLFFDSIVWAQRTGYPEYIIYNPQQCVPVYAITYLVHQPTLSPHTPTATPTLALAPVIQPNPMSNNDTTGYIPSFAWGFLERKTLGLQIHPKFELHASQVFLEMKGVILEGQVQEAKALLSSLEDEEDALSADLWDDVGGEEEEEDDGEDDVEFD
ncbi:UNVERIFIED_CONTAM: hypothetical protein HDU68_012290 [Siphonaria sp. JEL0065]|nr:hypothetical protein HDU68_012290 [Siphonaria sp. JEL0065]